MCVENFGVEDREVEAVALIRLEVTRRGDGAHIDVDLVEPVRRVDLDLRVEVTVHRAATELRFESEYW